MIVPVYVCLRVRHIAGLALDVGGISEQLIAPELSYLFYILPTVVAPRSDFVVVPRDRLQSPFRAAESTPRQEGHG